MTLKIATRLAPGPAWWLALCAGAALVGCTPRPEIATPSATPTSARVAAVPPSLVPPSPVATGSGSPVFTPSASLSSDSDEDRFRALYQHGYELVLAKDPEHGVPLLLQASKMRPNDPDTNFWLWRALSKTDPKRALPYARRVVTLMQGRPQAEQAKKYLAVNSGALASVDFLDGTWRLRAADQSKGESGDLFYEATQFTYRKGTYVCQLSSGGARSNFGTYRVEPQQGRIYLVHYTPGGNSNLKDIDSADERCLIELSKDGKSYGVLQHGNNPSYQGLVQIRNIALQQPGTSLQGEVVAGWRVLHYERLGR